MDVPAAAGVRHDREALMTLARSVARNVSSEARVSTLAADMSSAEADTDAATAAVWRQTVTQYLAALRRVFLLEDQPAWGVHLQSKAVLRKAPKRHFVDPSLAAAALGATPRRLLAEPKSLGLLFESLVVRDLRIYSQPQQAAVYHYRDSDDLEVDAVVARDDGLWLAIEVKLRPQPRNCRPGRAQPAQATGESRPRPANRPCRSGSRHRTRSRIPPSRRHTGSPRHSARPPDRHPVPRSGNYAKVSPDPSENPGGSGCSSDLTM